MSQPRRLVAAGRAALVAAEAAAIGRVAAGRGAVQLDVPEGVGIDGRVLTLVRRVRDAPVDLLQRHARGLTRREERMPAADVHLTVLDCTVALRHEAGGSDVAAERVAERVAAACVDAPPVVRAVRLGATDATVFLAVEDARAWALRAAVLAALGQRPTAATVPMVVNLARFTAPPTLGALLRLDRRRRPVALRLEPPELVWTDKRLSAEATEVVARFG